MAAMVSHQSVASLQSHGYIGNSVLHQECGNISMKLIRGGFKLEIEPSKIGGHCCRKRSFGSIHASSSSLQNSASNPILTPLSGTNKDRSKKSSEATLILIRRGESLWNEKKWLCKMICNIAIDMIYTSSLIRARCTNDCYACHDSTSPQKGTYCHA